MSNKTSAALSFNGTVLLVAAVLIIPLFFLTTTIDPALTPRFTLLSVALLFAVIFGYKDFRAAAVNGQCGYLRRMMMPAVSAYLFCMILSLTQAINVSEGIFEVLKTLLFLIVLFVATVTIRTHNGSLIVLVKGISLLTIIVSVIGVSQYYHLGFGWIPGAAEAQPFSTFANRNLFSSFLFLTFPFTVLGFFSLADRWHDIAGISIASATYAILIAQTRAVWVASALSFGFMAVAAVVFISRKKPRFNPENLRLYKARTRQLCLLLVVVIALNFLQPLLFRASPASTMTTAERAASIFDEKNRSRNERIILWKKTMLMIRDNSLLGVGAGNWKIVLPKYGVADTRMATGEVHFSQPHNDFLWVASETGIPGLIAYAALFLFGIYYCLRILNASDNFDDHLLSITMACGIIGYLTISFFDFPKERIEHLLYIALILSTILATYDKLFPLRMKHMGMVIPGLCGIIVLVLAFSIGVGCFRVHAEIHTRKALAAKQTFDWDGVIREIDEAYSEYATIDPMVTPLPWYRGVAFFSKNNTTEALKDFERAYAIHPYHIHVLNNLGTCYEVSGDHSKAIEFYTKALAISPRFEESLLNLTAAYFNSGRYEDAYQTLMKCNGSKNPKVGLFLAAVKGKHR